MNEFIWSAVYVFQAQFFRQIKIGDMHRLWKIPINQLALFHELLSHNKASAFNNIDFVV